MLYITTAPISILQGQDIDSWNVYPSYSTINEINIDHDSRFWVITNGGFFSVKDRVINRRINTLDGLHRSDPASSAFDKTNNRLFLGYMDGTIDVVNLDNFEITSLDDIRRVSRFNDKQITQMEISENNLFVGTGFGIVVYNLEDLLVDNSYLKFGDFPAGLAVNAFDINADSVFVATNDGIAVASLNDNLIDGNNWKNFTTADGLPESSILDVLYFKGVIYTIGDNKLFKYSSNSWMESDGFGITNPTMLIKERNGERWLVVSEKVIQIREGSGFVRNIRPEFEGTLNTANLFSDFIYAGTATEGVIEIDLRDLNQRAYNPEGPYLNFFGDLTVQNEALAAASTPEFPGADPLARLRGYYIFKDNSWNNFNVNTNQTLSEDNFFNAYSIAENSRYFYVGSWGRGVARHDKETNDIKVFNAGNSNITGWNLAQEFVVITGLATDVNDNMWMISSDSEFSLYRQNNESEEWEAFTEKPVLGTYYQIHIDRKNQKWISLIDNLSSGNGRGLLVLDTGDPQNEADDRYVRLFDDPAEGNLPNNRINAIIEDKNGEIWIGTDRGVARFIFPDLIIDGGAAERAAQWLINEDTSAASRFLLRDVNATALAVNGENQKWLGSENQGIWLLNEEGSVILKHFNVDNSPLLSNNILDISVRPNTGEVLISTDLGLVSYTDVATEPDNEMSSLKIYPNPFVYNRHNRIIIDDLSESTTIKIMGVDGVVVNELQAEGGRVAWDGFDYDGKKLGSGVYLIVAYERDNLEKGIGKVVIIR